ncbi:FabD/lysophospholipase-like protein [Daldinia caldariorum]|uniref:FabD/lysophospholipase-like protein n=1 Tax=Daldinia caldariorum TaxID=326644 RepID=UPI0020088458|nr:FabD/lysophospholipase-like protein [Daldinia caldariorum]KAI1468633.1 FabD/lysophospholipase-like protein [Daldinia caldariorum]
MADGGGIRGICELRVLDEIMKRVQKAQNLATIPKPCDYFDLMGGTSTGGLVAILLSRFKMTTTEAIEAYYDFSGKIFSKRNRKGFMAYLAGHPFNERPLENIIKEMVAARQIGELMIDPRPEARSKAFVCSQPAHKQGQATRFRTYEPPPPLKRDASLDIPSPSGSLSSSSSSSHSSPSNAPSRSSASSVESTPVAGSPRLEGPMPVVSDPWNEYRDIQIWEAARATTAAPSYFDPIVISRGGDTRTFIDGAMGCNNPAKEVVDEAAALFGTDCVLGCLVSLGTGFSGEVTIGEAQKGVKKMVGLINNLKKIATNTEKVHEDLRNLIRADLDTYFRFQLPAGAENIRLHDYKKLDELSRLMQVYIEKESSEIDKVVRILVDKAKPRGISLGQIAGADHGQITPPKKDIRSRPHVSEFFVGRKEYLETLADALCPDPQRPNRKRHHLLYGQPGAGKSQTAAKFLDDYGHWFDMILWVDAMSKETLEAGFKELRGCSEFGYTGDGSAQSILHWLQTTEHSWILVLDDVRGDVSKYVPQGNNGAVFFTSQDKFMQPTQRSATMLDVLGEGEAVELLLSSAQLEEEADDKIRRDAVNLTKSLGYLPLAIEQAAATVRMQQWGIEEYAKKFESHRDVLLSRAGSDSQNDSLGLQAVHASFDVTYKVINTQAHDVSNEAKADAAKYALQLLNLFSFYHNEGLMGNILKRAVKLRPEDRKEDDYGTGIWSFADLLATDESGEWIEHRWQLGVDLLISYSLVKVAKDDQVRRVYSIHGLVHGWARERMPEHPRSVRAKAARLILFDSFTENQSTHDDFQYGFKILPHTRAVMKTTESVSSDMSLEITHQYKHCLLLEAAGVSGIDLSELVSVLLASQGHHGGLSERFLEIADTVIEATKRRGMLLPALELSRSCYRARALLYGMEHMNSVRNLVTTASLCIELGQYIRAAETLYLCLWIYEEIHPEEDKLPIKTALAIAHFHNHQTDQARDYLLETVEEAKRRYGTSHPKTLECLSNLAIFQTAQENFEEAESMLKHVMEIEDKLFGSRYMSRTYTLHNLGIVYYYQDRFDEAVECFSTASKLSRTLSHFDVRYYYQQYALAMAVYHKGDRKWAIERISRCCTRFKQMLSEQHLYIEQAERQRDLWIEIGDKDLDSNYDEAPLFPIFRY